MTIKAGSGLVPDCINRPDTGPQSLPPSQSFKNSLDTREASISADMNTDLSELTFSADPTRLDIDLIHRFLAEESHWARGIDRATVERSIEHSLCFGAFAGSAQVAFARVVSDRATFAFLCDVFVVAGWRGRGVAPRLLEAVFAHRDLQRLRRFALTSRFSASLYEAHGFAPLASAQIWRERHNADVYAQGGTK